jgi:hypothetical protein
MEIAVENDRNDQPQRMPNGRFAPGNVPLGHRRKGAYSRLTFDKRSVIQAAIERHGSDGEGTGGEAGYYDFLIRERPSDFNELHKRTIPPATKDSDADGRGTAPVFTIVPIQSGRFISTDGAQLLDEAEARAAAGAPLLQDAQTIEGEVAEPDNDGGGELISLRTGSLIDPGP